MYCKLFNITEIFISVVYYFSRLTSLNEDVQTSRKWTGCIIALMAFHLSEQSSSFSLLVLWSVQFLFFPFSLEMLISGSNYGEFQNHVVLCNSKGYCRVLFRVREQKQREKACAILTCKWPFIAVHFVTMEMDRWCWNRCNSRTKLIRWRYKGDDPCVSFNQETWQSSSNRLFKSLMLKQLQDDRNGI